MYAKYRFLSRDDVHSHFRMAAFGRLTSNNSHLHQEELETVGQNSGWESGIIATQLLHKVALSSSLSVEQVWDNAGGSKLPVGVDRSAVNYTFSVGKLMLPKAYTTYQQTNFNLMLEFMGQRLNGSGKSYLDFAPSVQFIIHSQARLDLAYRQQIYSQMDRQMRSLWLLKLEYTFFTL
ncbi:MAG: hypothetical protein EAZ62_02340 [Sphingobacteriia bacterium]|nr:MAG: hypothetical protein EAZ62_02340 [Sphingobacteriia bacterium]